MSALIAAIAVTGVILGLLIAVIGFLPAPKRTRSSSSQLTKKLSARVPRRRLLLIAGGVLGGLALWYITGLVVTIVIVPAAVIGLPILLARPKTTIPMLEAIESWTRNLAGLITASVGLEQAIIVSLSSAPEEIRPQVANLVYRLNARWPTAKALDAFADELDDATADVVVAHLKLAAKDRGPGLADALTDLASITFEEVRHRREIESDREKPRSTARNVTLVTVVVMGALAISGTFFAEYQTVLGQLLLSVYIAAYVGVLIWMRRMTLGDAAPRILVDTRTQGE